MSRRARRPIEVFSLSFLDVVSCGFGAVILLLVISKIAEPIVIEKISADLTGLVAKLEQEKFDLRGETRVLERTLISKQEQLSKNKEKLARLQGDLSKIRGQYAATRSNNQTKTVIEGSLARAEQKLSAEMRRLQGLQPLAKSAKNTVGGIPVDSEYIIFLIDTSGSMSNYAWPLVRKKMQEVLNAYPRVKGIQVMNDMGGYMFNSYKGKWIPDTKARRKAIVHRLSSWKPFSNSSPVEGIEAAIRRFYTRNKRISLYIFGDDFANGKMIDVVEEVSRLNKADKRGKRRVRIHAIGFPVMFAPFANASANAVRFASLMRVLAEQNGGSFVGLNDYRP